MSSLKRVKEEMQFLTGVITDDVDYLLYLILKKEEEDINPVSELIDIKKDSYMDENSLDDWFNKL